MEMYTCFGGRLNQGQNLHSYREAGKKSLLILLQCNTAEAPVRQHAGQTKVLAVDKSCFDMNSVQRFPRQVSSPSSVLTRDVRIVKQAP